MNTFNSNNLFEEAKKYIPGGVNSPVRAFKSVGGTPLFIKRGFGSYMVDVDDNSYIDFIGSWGPHLFGHNPKFLTDALKEAIADGTSFGAPSEKEVLIAKLITELVPSVEMIRMVNSGTEAAMSAVRAARGFTGRDKFIKFAGCYHGHADYFLIKAGSGALTLGVPTSPGVTSKNAEDTLLADFNDIDSVKQLISMYKGEIAAIVIEPVAGNMGVIAAEEQFLKELRDITIREGIVLVFDEVMTGFRVARGGAQELYGISPDITIFGKIIGGGLPVGAFGGRKEIMEKIAPVGPIYQAGTLSGNPLAMTAGYAMLSHIKENPNIYAELEEKSAHLEYGFRQNLKSLGFNSVINRVGSMICQFFTDERVNNFNDAVKSNTEQYGKYFHYMLEEGIYLAPAQFEAMFVSVSHSKEDLDKTIRAHYNSMKKITG